MENHNKTKEEIRGKWGQCIKEVLEYIELKKTIKQFLNKYNEYRVKLQDPKGDDDFCKYDTNLNLNLNLNISFINSDLQKNLNSEFVKNSNFKKLEAVCKDSFDDLTRDKMPQVIDSEINKDEFKKKLTIDKLKKLNDIKPLSIRTLIERLNEGVGFFPKLNDDDTKNAQIYMALIFYISNFKDEKNKKAQFDKLKRVILVLREPSIKEYIIKEKDKFKSSKEELDLSKLKPSQNEVKAGKTLIIALNIFSDAVFISKKKEYLKKLKSGEEIDEDYRIAIARFFTLTEKDLDALKKSSLDTNLESKIKEYQEKNLNEDITNKGEKISLKKIIFSKLFSLIIALSFKNLSIPKIDEINSNLSKEINKFTTGILVSNDDYVIDGHHRWSACLLLKKIIDSLPNEKFKFPNKVRLQMVNNLSFKEYYCGIMNHPLVYSASKEEELITPKNPSTVICPPQPGGSRKKRSLKKRKKKTRKQKGNKKKKTNIKRKN